MSIEPAYSLRRPGRIEALDLARGLALVAMAIYHFAWDLEFFGYAPAGLTAAGGWKLFARCIAASFLVLVGIGLVLAHGGGVRWPAFWRRFAMVAAAAAAISAVTYVAVPGGFIFFGILHQIALASLLGLAVLRLPPVATFVLAAAVIAAPQALRAYAFDHPLLWWVGLSTQDPRSNDYVPLFPWFGAVLVGMGVAGLAQRSGVVSRIGPWTAPGWTWPLRFGGRHSLAVYLLHQPILIGCVWLAAQIVPPTLDPPEVRFRESCERSCLPSRDEAFCARYCACMLDELESAGSLGQVMGGAADDALRAQVQTLADSCTAIADSETLGVDDPP